MLSKAKRPLTEGLFRRMQNILQHHKSNIIWRYGLYALTNFQFHLLARIDDTTQVLVENICVHDSFCNALKTRLNWSKNVKKEMRHGKSFWAQWILYFVFLRVYRCRWSSISGATLMRRFRRMFSASATTNAISVKTRTNLNKMD